MLIRRPRKPSPMWQSLDEVTQARARGSLTDRAFRDYDFAAETPRRHFSHDRSGDADDSSGYR